jgi:hypothetical protein
MRNPMKAGVLLFVILLLVLTGAALAAPATDPGALTARPNTGINSDCPFPASVDPICGIRITVYGSEPVNFYGGARMPWPAVVQEIPLHSGHWTVTFGDPGPNPDPTKCIARNDPRWTECGKFKGIHFGFYTDDPIVNLLSPNPSVWSHVGPPCVYFDSHGNEIPCTGLTSHSAANAGQGQVAILNAASNLAAARAGDGAKDGGQAFRIQNVRIAVASDIIPIDRLGPCDLQALNWEKIDLANDVLPASTDQGPGTLNVTIPDHILSARGWAVMVYDVTDLETGEVLTTSTLDFPLGKE